MEETHRELAVPDMAIDGQPNETRALPVLPPYGNRTTQNKLLLEQCRRSA